MRVGAIAARISAMHAPSLQPTSAARSIQCIHYRKNIRCHQLIGIRPRAADAATVATTVYQHGTIATFDQRRNLITPVATMAEAAMQQDHGRAKTVSPVPDTRSVVFDVSLTIRRRQRCGAVRFKRFEVVVVKRHLANFGEL